MEALETYTSTLAVLSAALLLVAAGLGTKQLVWKRATPVPARNPYTDEAIEARYHTSVIALVALERACVDRSLGNEDMSVTL